MPLALHFFHVPVHLDIWAKCVGVSGSIAWKLQGTFPDGKRKSQYWQPLRIHLFRVIYLDMWALSPANVMGTSNKNPKPNEAKRRADQVKFLVSTLQ